MVWCQLNSNQGVFEMGGIYSLFARCISIIWDAVFSEMWPDFLIHLDDNTTTVASVAATPIDSVFQTVVPIEILSSYDSGSADICRACHGACALPYGFSEVRFIRRQSRSQYFVILS